MVTSGRNEEWSKLKVVTSGQNEEWSKLKSGHDHQGLWWYFSVTKGVLG